MESKALLTVEVISQAESYNGIRAGILHLKDVLRGQSYQANLKGPISSAGLDDDQMDDWPAGTHTVLILGLYHPEDDLRLDYWERGDTWGNRRLREISTFLKKWLQEELQIAAYPLPYHVEKGGLFLKDAAVLSGLGIVGKNNLLLHPEWGPRIRFRSILLEGNFEPTTALKGFSPCKSFEVYCQKSCPVKSFPDGVYNRQRCCKQIDNNIENKVPDGEIAESGKRNLVIKYCRACEFSCPIGA